MDICVIFIKALLAVHGLKDGFCVMRKQNAEHMAPKQGVFYTFLFINMM